MFHFYSYYFTLLLNAKLKIDLDQVSTIIDKKDIIFIIKRVIAKNIIINTKDSDDK